MASSQNKGTKRVPACLPEQANRDTLPIVDTAPTSLHTPPLAQDAPASSLTTRIFFSKEDSDSDSGIESSTFFPAGSRKAHEVPQGKTGQHPDSTIPSRLLNPMAPSWQPPSGDTLLLSDGRDQELAGSQFTAALRQPGPLAPTLRGGDRGLALRPPDLPGSQQDDHNSSFTPMRAVQFKVGGVLSETEIAARAALGISTTYRGDIFNPRNQSASISAEENTSLFLTGLPSSCTVPLLLGMLRQHAPLGKVFATSILSPTPLNPLAAAKLQFFSRGGAVRLYELAREQPLFVSGYPVTVSWNYRRTAAQGTICSRVLIIAGQMNVVNINFLMAYFSSKMLFQWEEILVRSEDHEHRTRVLEWRFGSFRAQADAARQILQRDFKGIATSWGRDPLE